MNQWKIGNVKVSRVIEMEVPWDGTIILPDATPETLMKDRDWLHPTFIDDAGKIRVSIHAFVIESHGKRVIVDTCVGNDKVRSMPDFSGLHLPFLESLKSAGCDRESIDHVVCTHLHLDHVGWNTMLKDGKWVPTFPKAKYLVGGTE